MINDETTTNPSIDTNRILRYVIDFFWPLGGSRISPDVIIGFADVCSFEETSSSISICLKLCAALQIPRWVNNEKLSIGKKIYRNFSSPPPFFLKPCWKQTLGPAGQKVKSDEEVDHKILNNKLLECFVQLNDVVELWKKNLTFFPFFNLKWSKSLEV